MELAEKKKSYSETEMGEVLITPPLSNAEKIFLTKFFNKFHYVDKTKIDQGVYELAEVKKNSVSNKNISVVFEGIIQEMIAGQAADLLITFSDGEKLVPGIYCPLELSISSKDDFTDCITIKKKHQSKVECAQWLVFIIEHFLKKDCIAKILYPEKFNFLEEHTLNGDLLYKFTSDVKKIEVINNEVTVLKLDLPKHLFNLVMSGPIGYKEYCKITIQELSKYNKFELKEVVKLPESVLLDKLILNAKLNNSLKINSGVKPTNIKV